MIQGNFKKMTKSELRAYVIAHPNDQNAFHAFVDYFTADASSETFGLPQSQSDVHEIEKLIQERVQ